jgi:hypothetical protein
MSQYIQRTRNTEYCEEGAAEKGRRNRRLEETAKFVPNVHRALSK